MTVSCILIDDEPNALALLECYAGKTPLLQLKGSFFDAVEALAYLKQNPVDLIFTDIQMPLLSGLELAEILPAQQKFIFTTAFAEHALTSFRFSVIDYLLKPISYKRFAQSLSKLDYRSGGQSPAAQPDLTPPALFVKSGKQMVRVELEQLLFAKGEGEYVSLQFKSHRLLVYKRMKEVEQLLPANFQRVHHSFIVNTHHIRKVESNHVYIADQVISISQGYRAAFLLYLEQHCL